MDQILLGRETVWEEQIEMSENDFGSSDRPHRWRVQRHASDRSHYLLSAEEQLLQLISKRAPLAEVLNGICNGVDRQIGNVVSLISMVEDDASELAAMTMNAGWFGLYGFCSKSITNQNDELLGSLEMYCCYPRSPSAREFQLIGRAACLAAMAIGSHRDTEEGGDPRILRERSVRWRVLEWPVSMN
jgi:hypothetical protein